MNGRESEWDREINSMGEIVNEKGKEHGGELVNGRVDK